MKFPSDGPLAAIVGCRESDALCRTCRKFRFASFLMPEAIDSSTDDFQKFAQNRNLRQILSLSQMEHVILALQFIGEAQSFHT